MAEINTTTASAPSLGQRFTDLLFKGLDTAATYGAAKLNADAQKSATQARLSSDLAAANAMAAGSRAPGAAYGLPSWALPAGLGIGALVLVLVVLGLRRGK
jgi:hypothetical protein